MTSWRAYYVGRTVDDDISQLTDGIQAVLCKRTVEGTEGWHVLTGSGFPAGERVVYAFKDGSCYVTTDKDEFCKEARCFYGSTVTDSEFHAVVTKARGDLLAMKETDARSVA